jgi:hypothetical protein
MKTNNLEAVEFQCGDSGYRFWVVCAAAHTEAVIAEHREMGYGLSDVDRVAEGWAGAAYVPAPEYFRPENPTSGEGWALVACGDC